MYKRLLAVVLVSTISLGVFRSISYSNRNFAPVANTNAPGENSCARSGCHSTFGLLENLEERLSVLVDGANMDANFEYSPGSTYNMQLSIQNPKARNGFSLTVLNQAGEMAGNLSTSSNDAQVNNGPAGKKYVGHTNSLGVSSWDFEWTAPSDSQVLTVFSIANLSNNNGFTDGDSVLTKTFTFTAMVDTTSDTTATGIRSYVLSNSIQVISPLSVNGVVFNIDVLNANYFDFEIYNSIGQLMEKENFFLHGGKQQLSIPFVGEKGIYFLRVISEGKESIHRFVN